MNGNRKKEQACPINKEESGQASTKPVSPQEETERFLEEIENDPSRKAFTDGILPNELGC